MPRSLGRVSFTTRRRLSAVLCAAALAAGGCTAEQPGTAKAPAPASAAPSSTQTPQPREPASPTPSPEPAPAPDVGDCRNLTAAAITAPTDATQPVRCTRPHTAQTLDVGRIPRRVVGDRAEPDPRAIADYVTPRCERRFVRWIGGDRETRILSRLHAVWFLPSDDDLALGARWFRCDAIAFGTGDEPALLPRDVQGVLSDPGALDVFGVCSRGSPEEVDSVLVMCDRRHNWRAFDVLPVQPGRKNSYPSAESRRDARGSCRDASREELGYPLEWHYGWQRPSRRAWTDGVRHGLCWVPSN